MTDMEVTQVTEDTQFNIRDGNRSLTFVGHRLAAADSQGGDDVRWTELTLYRTITGKYVLETVGRSDVFHDVSCPEGSKSARHERLEEVADGSDDSIEDRYVPCPRCRPAYDQTPVHVERDLFSSQVYETAEVLVDAMHRRDKHGMRYLSRLSRTLLDDAGEQDDDVTRVMSTPADIT